MELKRTYFSYIFITNINTQTYIYTKVLYIFSSNKTCVRLKSHLNRLFQRVRVISSRIREACKCSRYRKAYIFENSAHRSE